MLRSSLLMLVLFTSTGCSLLHPAKQQHEDMMHNTAETTERVEDAVKSSHSSAELDADHDKSKRSVSDVVFAGVFVPVYATGCFFWWVANGCPDP